MSNTSDDMTPGRSEKKLKQQRGIQSSTEPAALSADATHQDEAGLLDRIDVCMELATIERKTSGSDKIALNIDEHTFITPYLSDDFSAKQYAMSSKNDEIDRHSFHLETLLCAVENARYHLKTLISVKTNLQQQIQTIDAYLDPRDDSYSLTDVSTNQLKYWDERLYTDGIEVEVGGYKDRLVETIDSTSNITGLNDADSDTKRQVLYCLLCDLKEEIANVILANTEQSKQLSEHIFRMAKRLDNLKYGCQSINTFFEMDVVVSNRGSVDTSLQPVALMCVEGSDGHCVDLRMHMNDHKQHANLPPLSIQVIRYHSPELYCLSFQEYVLIRRLWGGANSVRLLTLDFNNCTHISSSIAFASTSGQNVSVN